MHVVAEHHFVGSMECLHCSVQSFQAAGTLLHPLPNGTRVVRGATSATTKEQTYSSHSTSTHQSKLVRVYQGCLPESWTGHDFVPVLPLRMLQDPFNATQTWLDLKGFEYDELIVVDGPESKAVFIDVHCMNCMYCTCVILSIGTNGYTPIDSKTCHPGHDMLEYISNCC